MPASSRCGATLALVAQMLRITVVTRPSGWVLVSAFPRSPCVSPAQQMQTASVAQWSCLWMVFGTAQPTPRSCTFAPTPAHAAVIAQMRSRCWCSARWTGMQPLCRAPMCWGAQPAAQMAAHALAASYGASPPALMPPATWMPNACHPTLATCVQRACLATCSTQSLSASESRWVHGQLNSHSSSDRWSARPASFRALNISVCGVGGGTLAVLHGGGCRHAYRIIVQ